MCNTCDRDRVHGSINKIGNYLLQFFGRKTIIYGTKPFSVTLVETPFFILKDREKLKKGSIILILYKFEIKIY